MGSEGQDFGDVVRDKQGRDARARKTLAQDSGDLGGGFNVEGSGRLVEDEHIGAEHERAGDGDARRLPAGQVGGTPVGKVGDTHGAQLLEGDCPGLSSPDAAHA